MVVPSQQLTSVVPILSIPSVSNDSRGTVTSSTTDGASIELTDTVANHLGDVYTDTHNNTTVITAFSRDQEHKVYVTDKIRTHGQLVWDALEKGARVFIAGSAKNMPKDVRVAMTVVVMKYGGMSTMEEAAAYVARLEKTGRYTVEAWSA
jgi:sulfite reductase alpha subunit-like flavoprotein